MPSVTRHHPVRGCQQEPTPGGTNDRIDHRALDPRRDRPRRRRVDDAEAGIYRANRRIFTDEEIFELEMKHIFEGNWIYLAHESQVPNPGDYFTTYIGRQPVVITRDKERRDCTV